MNWPTIGRGFAEIISEWPLRCGMEINSALPLFLNCGAYKVEKAAMSPFKAKDITRFPLHDYDSY